MNKKYTNKVFLSGLQKKLPILGIFRPINYTAQDLTLKSSESVVPQHNLPRSQRGSDVNQSLIGRTAEK